MRKKSNKTMGGAPLALKGWRRIIPLICARKGSSLKDKNLREYNGTPLLRSAIERTLAAFGTCYVLTDSEDYAARAKEWGANVPYIDEEIAGGDIVSAQIFRFIGRLGLVSDEDFGRTLIALIQCTSPNTSIDTLRGVAAVADRRIPPLENYTDQAFVAASAYELPNKANAIFADVMAGAGVFQQQLDGTPIDTPRQRLRKLYGLTGGIFVVPARQVFQRGRLCVSVFSGRDSRSTRFFFHIAPLSEALDIDRAEDFNRK